MDMSKHKLRQSEQRVDVLKEQLKDTHQQATEAWGQVQVSTRDYRLAAGSTQFLEIEKQEREAGAGGGSTQACVMQPMLEG